MISDNHTENSLSNEDFDSVYKFIAIQIQKQRTQFYSYKDYEFHLYDNSEIFIKKSGYTLSKVWKENGIFSFAKTVKENREMIVKTNKLFLEILAFSNKNFNNQ